MHAESITPYQKYATMHHLYLIVNYNKGGKFILKIISDFMQPVFHNSTICKKIRVSLVQKDLESTLNELHSLPLVTEFNSKLLL